MNIIISHKKDLQEIVQQCIECYICDYRLLLLTEIRFVCLFVCLFLIICLFFYLILYSDHVDKKLYLNILL